MALIEIEVLRCDEDERNAALRRVIEQLGPADGTIVLELDSGEEFSDELVEEIVDSFGEFGEIILVR
jgi:synaptojanin